MNNRHFQHRAQLVSKQKEMVKNRDSSVQKDTIDQFIRVHEDIIEFMKLFHTFINS